MKRILILDENVSEQRKVMVVPGHPDALKGRHNPALDGEDAGRVTVDWLDENRLFNLIIQNLEITNRLPEAQ